MHEFGITDQISGTIKENSNLVNYIIQQHFNNEQNAFIWFPVQYILSLETTVIEKVVTYIVSKANANTNVIFVYKNEGYYIKGIIGINKIIKRLVEDFNFNIDNFYFTNIATPSQYSINKYKNLFNYYPFLPRNVFFDPYCERNQSLNSSPRLGLTTGKISKKFLCLNGRPRPHRLIVLSELLHRNLLDKGYISTAEFESDYGYTLHSISSEKLSPSLIERTEIGIEKLMPSFPTNLTLTHRNRRYLDNSDIKFYRSSIFSLVTETIFYDDVDIMNQDMSSDNALLNKNKGLHHFPCTLISEKTWKPIRAEQPFIVCATPFFLHDLRTLGYKTFHPYIDESYDEILNVEQRIIKVMDEVERLCNLSEDELEDWFLQVKKITKFNYELLTSKNNFNPVYVRIDP